MPISILTALMGLFILSGSQASLTTNEPSFSVKLTAYNAVAAQTDGDPHITASGAFSNPEVVAARSRDLADALPFGTVIALEAPSATQNSCGYDAVEHLIGYRVIADSMHSRKSEQVDVLLDAADTVRVGGKLTNPSRALGVCEGVGIRVVGHLDLNNMPKTQAELVRFVEGKKVAMR